MEPKCRPIGEITFHPWQALCSSEWWCWEIIFLASWRGLKAIHCLYLPLVLFMWKFSQSFLSFASFVSFFCLTIINETTCMERVATWKKSAKTQMVINPPLLWKSAKKYTVHIDGNNEYVCDIFMFARTEKWHISPCVCFWWCVLWAWQGCLE